jgi:hypothetical protein
MIRFVWFTMIRAAALIAAKDAAITTGFRKLITIWNNGLMRAVFLRG